MLDASWHNSAWRTRAAQVAADTSSDLIELQCTAPAKEAAARLARRAHEGGDPSDADAAVAAAMATSADPWPSAVAIDTSGPPAATLHAALAVLPARTS